MPSPVEALPWGSRSTISTSSPIAASAVPRLMAVVVLPTPPFWLARASTRGARLGLRGASFIRRLLEKPNPRKPSDYKVLPFCRAPYPDNSAARIGPAGDEIVLDSPRFRGLGQFSLYILSLQKQADGTPFQQRNCVAQK